MRQQVFQKLRAIFSKNTAEPTPVFAEPIGAYSSWIGGASDASLDKSYCRGAVVRVGWKDIETSAGVFNWTALDAYVDDCKSRGKKWTLAVGAGTPGCPDWVTAGATQTYSIYFRPLENPDPFTIAAPWDAYYLARLELLAAALAARYGSDPDLLMVYVPQQTGNGIEGHFNANTDASLTSQGINATSWVTYSKMACHIFAAAFPDKSIAFEVHKVLSSATIPMDIVNQMYAETSGQLGAAIWWLKGTMTEQVGLIDALYDYPGKIFAQPIGNSGDASRFPTDADYLAVITQARDLGCRYVEFWDYEYLNDTFPDHLAAYNVWADGGAWVVRPNDLTANVVGSTVTLTVTDRNDGNAVMQWERSSDAGATWTVIAETAAGVVEYVDSGLANWTYHYRVRAEVGETVTGWSNTIAEVLAASGDSVTITGTDFGVAPNVILYRTLDGTPGETVSLAPPAGEIGTFTTASMKYATGGGANGFDANTQRTLEFVSSPWRRMRISTSLKVPDGFYPPGRDNSGYETWSTDSGWKPVWAMLSGDGDSIGWEPDVCIPTHIGNGNISLAGNTNSYGQSFASSANNASRWAWDSYNTFQLVHDSDSANPCVTTVPMRWMFTSAVLSTLETSFTLAGYPVISERIEFVSGGPYIPAGSDVLNGVTSGTTITLSTGNSRYRLDSGEFSAGTAAGSFFYPSSAPNTWVAGEQINITKASDGSTVTDAATINTGDTLPGIYNSDAFFDRIKYNAYARMNSANPERTQAVYRNLYLAVESSDGSADYKQMVFLGNASTLAGCSKIKPKIATSWSATSVTIPVSSAERAEYTHAFVQRADSTYVSQVL